MTSPTPSRASRSAFASSRSAGICCPVPVNATGMRLRISVSSIGALLDASSRPVNRSRDGVRPEKRAIIPSISAEVASALRTRCFSISGWAAKNSASSRCSVRSAADIPGVSMSPSWLPTSLLQSETQIARDSNACQCVPGIPAKRGICSFAQAHAIDPNGQAPGEAERNRDLDQRGCFATPGRSDERHRLASPSWRELEFATGMRRVNSSTTAASGSPEGAGGIGGDLRPPVPRENPASTSFGRD